MVYHLALVTGATSGIGKATCQLLAQQGVEIIASGRNAQQLRLLQEQLSKQITIRIIEADLAKPQDRQKLVKMIRERVPDLVINNAGFGLYGEALTHSTAEQMTLLEVNGQAVLELTLEAVRALTSQQKQGVILNVSSAAGFQVFPNMAVYAASKAFVTQFSQALDFEVRKQGVRVLTLCPGMVATAFQERAGGAQQRRKTGVMTPAFVAAQMWKQIEQLRPLVIINWQYRMLTFLSFLLPTSWVARLCGRIIAERITPRTLNKMHE